MATQMTERYCPICGKPGQPEFNRFGEWACSETHAEEHVVEVRAQKERLLTGGIDPRSRSGLSGRAASSAADETIGPTAARG